MVANAAYTDGVAGLGTPKHQPSGALHQPEWWRSSICRALCVAPPHAWPRQFLADCAVCYAPLSVVIFLGALGVRMVGGFSPDGARWRLGAPHHAHAIPIAQRTALHGCDPLAGRSTMGYGYAYAVEALANCGEPKRESGYGVAFTIRQREGGEPKRQPAAPAQGKAGFMRSSTGK
mmetsp:Transcript_60258/g.168260  ORF Transcript_60258/g.168260 Transcript_60258/m.168260 type:complete len:176 (-) Transcript_60258:592-1119(-)